MSTTPPRPIALSQSTRKKVLSQLQPMTVDKLKDVVRNLEFKKIVEEMEATVSDDPEKINSWATQLSEVTGIEDLEDVDTQEGLKEAIQLIQDEFSKKVTARAAELETTLFAHDLNEITEWFKSEGKKLVQEGKLDDYIVKAQSLYSQYITHLTDRGGPIEQRKNQLSKKYFESFKEVIEGIDAIPSYSLVKMNNFLALMKSVSPELDISEFQTRMGKKLQAERAVVQEPGRAAASATPASRAASTSRTSGPDTLPTSEDLLSRRVRHLEILAEDQRRTASEPLSESPPHTFSNGHRPFQSDAAATQPTVKTEPGQHSFEKLKAAIQSALEEKFGGPILSTFTGDITLKLATKTEPVKIQVTHDDAMGRTQTKFPKEALKETFGTIVDAHIKQGQRTLTADSSKKEELDYMVTCLIEKGVEVNIGPRAQKILGDNKTTVDNYLNSIRNSVGARTEPPPLGPESNKGNKPETHHP